MTVITAPPLQPETIAHAGPAQSASLDKALASGLAWTAVFRWAAQLFSWCATFYAARQLVPADYGLVSMATITVGVARLIEGFGLDAILVQDRTLVGERQARVAGFVVAASIALIAMFWLLAPLAAPFFHEPQVPLLIRVLSLVLIFDALQVVPRATLQRSLRFRQLAFISFVQVVTTGAVLIASVTFGFGYWSLVLNTLGGAAVATCLMIAWAPFAVAWPRDLATIALPLLQGWRVLASRVAWYGYSTADRAIVGRALGKDLLGAYSFSVTLSMIGNDEIGSIVSRVTPGVLSRVQDRKAELRRYYVMLTQLLTIMAFPVAIGVAITADLLVPLLLGPKWIDVILPLRLLCLYSAFLSAQQMNADVLMWTGQFRVNMWLSVLALVVMPATLLFAVRFGLAAVAIAWAFVFPVLNVPAFYYAFRTMDASWRDWLDAITPAIVGCAMMVIAVSVMQMALPEALPLAVTTAIVVATGAVAYVSTLWFGFHAQIRALLRLKD